MSFPGEERSNENQSILLNVAGARLGLSFMTKNELNFIFQGNERNLYDIQQMGEIEPYLNDWISLAYRYPGWQLTENEAKKAQVPNLDIARATTFNQRLNIARTMRWLNDVSNKEASLLEYVVNIPLESAGNDEKTSSFCLASVRQASARIKGVKDIIGLAFPIETVRDELTFKYIQNCDFIIKRELNDLAPWRELAYRQIEAVSHVTTRIENIRNSLNSKNLPGNGIYANNLNPFGRITQEIFRYSSELTGLRNLIPPAVNVE